MRTQPVRSHRIIHSPYRRSAAFFCPTALFLAVVCTRLACTEASTEPNVPTANIARDAAGYELPSPGVWLLGDLHVHATGASNDTGGDSHPTAIAEQAKDMGLDFVVLTDHSNSTGSDPSTREEDPVLFNQGPEFVYWSEAAALTRPGEFWVVSGNEISPVSADDDLNTPRGHIGCLPTSLVNFDTDSAFIDRPKGMVTGGEALQQALARGCFTIVNHPYAITPWVAYDWTHMGYQGMEVWNGSGGGYDLYDQQGYDAWRCDQLAGRAVTPIAASDNHRIHTPAPGEVLHPALGWPTTAVWVAERSWAGIIAGLQSAQVALFEGDSRLYLDGYDSDKRHAKGNEIYILRVRGTLDTQSVLSGKLRVHHATSCEDPRPTPLTPVSITETILLDTIIEAGESFDIAVPIEGHPGVYSATLLTNTPTEIVGSRYAALSKGVVIPP